jgi:dipeptidyl aminopeptidase/acylaminoacyl peptidase
MYETNAGQLSMSDNGTLVFLRGGVYPEERRFVTWVDRAGNEERWDLPMRHYLGPRLSPDGQQLAVMAGGGFDTNILIIDSVRGTTARLTTSGEALMGTWTPDGKRYCFAGTRGTYCREVDMSGDVESLAEGEDWQFPSSWTPDGKLLAFVEWSKNTGSDIWLLRTEEGHEPIPLMQTTADEAYPEFSPDGRWIAYATNESGQYEVYVQSFPEAGEKYQISTDGGLRPAWSKDGTEIFYRKGDQVLAVSVETGSSFVAGRPRVLFERYYVSAIAVRTYDISLDGKRFVMIGREPFPDTPITHLNVTLNWFEELERLAPRQ